MWYVLDQTSDKEGKQMPTRKVPKQSSPSLVRAAARALTSNNSGKKVKTSADGIFKNDGHELAPKNQRQK
jgi:hypothetical protein